MLALAHCYVDLNVRLPCLLQTLMISWHARAIRACTLRNVSTWAIEGHAHSHPLRILEIGLWLLEVGFKAALSVGFLLSYGNIQRLVVHLQMSQHNISIKFLLCSYYL